MELVPTGFTCFLKPSCNFSTRKRRIQFRKMLPPPPPGGSWALVIAENKPHPNEIRDFVDTVIVVILVNNDTDIVAGIVVSKFDDHFWFFKSFSLFLLSHICSSGFVAVPLTVSHLHFFRLAVVWQPRFSQQRRRQPLLSLLAAVALSAAAAARNFHSRWCRRRRRRETCNNAAYNQSLKKVSEEKTS